MPPFAKQWLGGLLGAVVVVYVLALTQQTQDRTVAIATRVGDCQLAFAQAIKDRADITTQDSKLSNNLSDLRNEIDDATGTWINRLLNPPADIAALAINDDRRQAWPRDVTVVYFERTSKLRDQVTAVVAERKRLADVRATHPLPDPQC